MAAPEKIRVLIVDDITETRENIRRMLQFEASVEICGTAQSGKEAIEMAQQLKPDVVIMDINMPDMDGISATEAIRKKLSFVQVVILSVQSDPSYMRRAMLAGARDYLTKPPMIDELTSAVRRAGAMAHEERSKAAPAYPTMAEVSPSIFGQVTQLGKIIVVYSPKGGTGCTTIATNLSLALQTDASKTVLVDGNLQFGDVAVFLNEQGKNNVIDLTSRVDELDPEIVHEVMVTHTASGLNILAAPPRPEHADQVTGEQFGKLIDYLQKLYAYVVIDTACYLTDVVQVAIDRADFIALITTQEIPSIKSSNLFLSLADASGIKRDRIIFVMNRYDKRIAITPEKVGESLRQEIVVTIPLDEKIVPNSINRGTPFYLENKTYPVSKCILALADIIHQRSARLDGVQEKDYSKK